MKLPQKIEMTITKTKDGYRISDETNSRLCYYTDEDRERLAFIDYIIENFMNTPVEDGRKYK